MKTLKQAGIDAKKFEFKAAGTTACKYPWDTFFDGNANVLIQGEDYPETIPTLHMTPKIKTAARRRYKTVKLSTRDHNGNKLANGGIVVQAFDMTTEEREHEDTKRAEEKAKVAAERQAEKDDAQSDEQQAA